MSIVPGDRLRPTVVFEFGYTERYEDLKDNAKLLLEGTQGKIIKAIIIKIEPLRPGETTIQKGFVELWSFVNGRTKKDGGEVTILTILSGRGLTNKACRTCFLYQGTTSSKDSL